MKWLTPAFLALAGLGIPHLQAAPQCLIISGGGNVEVTRREYYHDCAFVYLVQSQRGIDPIVVAEDGQWSFVQNPERSFPAFTMEDLESAFALLASGLEPGDPVDIHISDHGDWAPEGEPAWNGSFILYHPSVDQPWLQVSHQAFMDLIRRHIPVANPVRLTGSYCFSGGIHQVAFELPHVVCSTLTDLRSVSIRREGPAFTYTNAVWGTFQVSRRNTPRTLYHAHWEAMTGERMNEGRGSLSSMAYVDSVLKRGSYSELPAMAGVSSCEKHAHLVHAGEVERLIGLSFDQPAHAPANAPSPEAEEGWQTLANAATLRTVEEGEEDTWTLLSRPELDQPPLPALAPERAAMLKLLQADLARDYRQARKAYDSSALAYKRQLLQMEAQWNGMSWFQRALYTALPSLSGRQDWEARTQFDLSQYSHILRRAESLQNILAFLGTATPNEIDKFFQLFSQELAPLA